jgi:RNA polymerase sigma-70 factor (ECF subfamily)
LVALLPQLRAFARSLCGNRTLADDLVQEAAIRAWSARSTFAPGSSMKAWTFTILRNVFLSNLRRERRQTPPSPDTVRDWTPAEQESDLHIAALERALARLGPERRTALLLVTIGDFSYAEAARICDCPIGTLRSRISRARRDLAEMLDAAEMLDNGPLPTD